MKYRVRMQTIGVRWINSNPEWAGLLPPFNANPVDINIAHEYCDTYNQTSRRAHSKTVQSKTKYWVEEYYEKAT